MAKDLKISYLLECYGNLLTEKQRHVVDMYYNEDLSLAEIAEIESITRQGVRDFLKKAETQLYETEQKLHLLQKIGLLQKLAKEENYREISEHIHHFFSDWEA
ncbi:MAG: DNA-binding protein [Clostridia bacterium]|nr:DNA-binding protein [Clostridia bacterium]